MSGKTFVKILFLGLAIILSVRAALCQGAPAENSHSPFMEWYQENEADFNHLKDLIEENDRNLSVTCTHTRKNDLWETFPDSMDIVNYDSIVIFMDRLLIGDISYQCDVSTLTFHSQKDDQEAIVYRMDEPTQDEIGIWKRISENCYWVYFTYT